MLFHFSWGIRKIPLLDRMIGQAITFYLTCFWRLPKATAIVVWGYRPSARKGEYFARRRQLPLLRIEDGWLRSIGLGGKQTPPLSLVIDDLALYYHSGLSSRLEQLILAQQTKSTPGADLQPTAAQQGLALLRQHHLSKYNHAPAIALPKKMAPLRVLIIDQTVGDMSVILGRANQALFEQMLASAIMEYPDAEIWVKTHPDVLAGKKQGYLPQVHAPVQIMAQDICPYSLLSQVDIVYTATSHMGFEALVVGCKVICFGMPWYCGWGLTEDRHPEMAKLKERRNVTRTLEQLFDAAYLQYARYLQPDRGIRGTFFDLAEWIAINKQHHQTVTGTLWCVGMSLWKRKIVKPFLSSPQTRLRFVRSLAALPTMLPKDSQLVCWGIQPTLESYAHQHNLPLLHMEDGFLRSVGLGTYLLPALSLVVDNQGLYYDASRPSQLEQLIHQQTLSPEALQRAAALKQKLVAHKISKYNIGSTLSLPIAAKGKRIILVPGQVEGDASLRYGTRDIRTNLQLLRAAREAAPQGWIIYKPHPDVVAGTREGEVNNADISTLADQIVIAANIADCLQVADEVHVMTSLAGFEALLHGKIVHCYGAPFYAGWGVTHDRYPLPNRQRKLTVDELIYAVLISYPRYIIPGRAGFSRPEAVVDYLIQQPQQRTIPSGWRKSYLIKIAGLWRTWQQ